MHQGSWRPSMANRFGPPQQMGSGTGQLQYGRPDQQLYMERRGGGPGEREQYRPKPRPTKGKAVSMNCIESHLNNYSFRASIKFYRTTVTHPKRACTQCGRCSMWPIVRHCGRPSKTVMRTMPPWRRLGFGTFCETETFRH
jgi:hypothetical protein